jgi:hypothetical protein
VAGPALSSSSFHAATVSDGPNGHWSEGTYVQTEGRNRALLRNHFAAWEVDQRRREDRQDAVKPRLPKPPLDAKPPVIPTADALELPAFLRRQVIR